MQRLLGELLELSRIGRMVNEPETVSFADIVREALELVRGRLEAGKVTVRVADGLPAVPGDRVRLVEVVQNLLDNAAKFTGGRPDALVDVGAGPIRDGEAEFYVRDNGIGIDPAYHERVFGLFTKLDPASEGTGVGLALVKRIVEVHGGRVRVASNGEGRGTTFYFTLPVSPDT
jgi:signal transduction histidine kinase